MKTLRIWLLVLLAVLLPVRGAMAAAMLCPPSGVGSQSELRMIDGSVAAHHGIDTQAQPAHDHAQHGHDSSSDAGGELSSGGEDKCNLCSAFCSVTSLVSSPPVALTPGDLATVAFADLFAPAPSFLSDGQERPPRSI
ncbi:DUF2946 family protein [Piscinibacter koreensis]|uniref:DUF2946 domain-containing protein n=1 Tax=Piscinibacter koreensis TaxID=2742824 RepID=A0A7Y6TYV3_9BURK|nr:DUF2946 family protein [Schlegelella koreensis]NUZ08495.1 hypothetical protein [Schlegelella koreensis]